MTEETIIKSPDLKEILKPFENKWVLLFSDETEVVSEKEIIDKKIVGNQNLNSSLKRKSPENFVERVHKRTVRQSLANADDSLTIFVPKPPTNSIFYAYPAGT